MLDVRNLRKTFGSFTAVKDVSFSVQQGEILGLIGPNGSGKSTTFGCLAGMLVPTAGSVTFSGQDITGMSPASVCRLGVARTFQIPRPFEKLSVLENVAVAAYYGSKDRISRRRAFTLAEEALDLVGLQVDSTTTTVGLGAAALKKIELARALATQPTLLLADESLGGLDAVEIEQAADMLAALRDKTGMTIVWVEHIMGVLMRIVDRLIVLDRGEVVVSGPPAQVAADPKIGEIYFGDA